MLGTEREQAVRRLAQYRPFPDQGQELQALLRNLLMSAAMIDGGSFASLAAAQTGVRDLWGIDIEIDEIRAVVDAMAADGRCEKIGGGYRLTEDARAELNEIAEQSNRDEETALSQWQSSLRDLDSRITEDDVDALAEDLRAWLGRVISHHGVESALFLYPENPRAQELFKEVDEFGVDFLPEREGCAGQIRDRAFALFVRQPTPEQ